MSSYEKTIDDVLNQLNSNERGLSSSEANIRLEKHGKNKLPESKPRSHFSIFLDQFKSPLIFTLFGASIAVLLLGDVTDFFIIISVLIFNAIIGTIQEGRAEDTVRALRNFVETNATVIRDDTEMIIPDYDVVIGDIIILNEGDKVPSDARLIYSRNLKLNESGMTGESVPVHKTLDPINSAGLNPSEQKNMVFKGTYVAFGYGKAVVTSIGVDTVIGKIASEISTIDTEIPLKTDIKNLSRFIIIAVLGVSVLIFTVGVIIGGDSRTLFATVVAMTVSLVPEGLPIVLTLVLASGMWRMSKKNVLIKKLQAVEALGQAQIIAVDKTGTVTKNEMMVREVYVDNDLFEVGGVGYEPKGEIKFSGKTVDQLNHQSLIEIGRISAFCANAVPIFSEETKSWRVSGDPTEAAMLVFSQKIGFHKDELERENIIIDEQPFDYNLKYSAVIHKTEKSNFNTLSLAGAPEIILSLSDTIWQDGGAKKISEGVRIELEKIFTTMMEKGLRVVGIAKKNVKINELKKEDADKLTFLGFLGIEDTLRPEVHEAMERTRNAGIKVVMITGDHVNTARAIAREAGIYTEGDAVISGSEIDSMSEKEFINILPKVSVFARVTPEHKMKIINAYKKTGKIVAMTGDGVNDAPSLAAADLGVAMGRIGTEVAKEASDLVLLDDNFGSIVGAVEEGRNMYKTIKKVILYLFSTGLGELLTIIGAMVIGLPIPILPGQIIWLNFVTDGFLDVSLAMEPKEDNLLSRSFRKPGKYLVDKAMLKRMFIMAVPMMLGTLFLFSKYTDGNMTKAYTMSLCVLAVFQWFNAWNCRSDTRSIFRMNPFSNKFLLGATAIVIALQMFIIYNPFMQDIMKTTAISLKEWGLVVLVASSIIIVEEVRKFIYRKK
ncbi:MAG: HAD-IC family P-type ATPase [Patescibacteria group bacterium]